MHTLLDYLAWISITLAVATVLFLVLATCLLLAQGVVRMTRWISNLRTDLSRLPATAWHGSVKLHREAAYLVNQQPKLGAHIHLHTGRAKPRA